MLPTCGKPGTALNVVMIRRRLVAALAGCLLLTGCGVTIPTDPEGTLADVRGGVLRVGVSPNPPWTEEDAVASGGPGGIEPDLVRGFAEQVDAEIEWTSGAEQTLFDQLDRGELDLVVGGLTAKSPWSSHAALTYPYAQTEDPSGAKELHVMAVRVGENAFMTELERYLLEQEVQP